MQPDSRFEHVLCAVIALLNEMDARPMAQHERLSLMVYTILYLIDNLDEERAQRLQPSPN